MAIYVTIDLPATPSQLAAFFAGADTLGATLIDKDGPRLITRIELDDEPAAEERAVAITEAGRDLHHQLDTDDHNGGEG